MTGCGSMPARVGEGDTAGAMRPALPSEVGGPACGAAREPAAASASAEARPQRRSRPPSGRSGRGGWSPARQARRRRVLVGERHFGAARACFSSMRGAGCGCGPRQARGVARQPVALAVDLAPEGDKLAEIGRQLAAASRRSAPRRRGGWRSSPRRARPPAGPGAPAAAGGPCAAEPARTSASTPRRRQRGADGFSLCDSAAIRCSVLVDLCLQHLDPFAGADQRPVERRVVLVEGRDLRAAARSGAPR